MNRLRGGRTQCALATAVALVATTSAGVGQTPKPGVVVHDPAARNERATELTARGLRLVERGDPGSAVWFLREALAIEPAHAAAAIGLADIYLARGEPSDAREVAQATSARAPGYAALWLRLSRALFLLGDSDGAIVALGEGLRHSPRDVALLRAQVDASLKRGQWIRAQAVARVLATSGGGAEGVDHAAVAAALRILVGTSDRARGMRCVETLSIVRRALSRCQRPP